MGTWTLWLWDTRSAEVSLTGTRDFALVNRGTKSQVLPTVNWGGEEVWRAACLYTTTRGCLSAKLARKAASYVNGSAIEYKVRRSELPIGVHEYLGTEHEVQVPHMHYSDVRSKPSVICTKIIQKPVSVCSSKTITSKTRLKELKVLDTDQLLTAIMGRGARRQASCCSPELIPH